MHPLWALWTSPNYFYRIQISKQLKLCIIRIPQYIIIIIAQLCECFLVRKKVTKPIVLTLRIHTSVGDFVTPDPCIWFALFTCRLGL